MNDLLTNLERDTGYRVRVLCQAYPRTPGLAIRDYWDLGKEVSRHDVLMLNLNECALLKRISCLLPACRELKMTNM